MTWCRKCKKDLTPRDITWCQLRGCPLAFDPCPASQSAAESMNNAIIDTMALTVSPTVTEPEPEPSFSGSGGDSGGAGASGDFGGSQDN